MPFCRKCGQQERDDSAFCSDCGTALAPLRSAVASANLTPDSNAGRGVDGNHKVPQIGADSIIVNSEAIAKPFWSKLSSKQQQLFITISIATIALSVVAIALLFSVGKKKWDMGSNSSAENITLSKIGASCLQNKNEIPVSFRNTTIPSGSKITQTNVCEMMNNAIARQIEDSEKAFEPLCIVAAELIASRGYERALELSRLSVIENKGQPNEAASQELFVGVNVCHSTEKKRATIKKLIGETIIFSVGTIINPVTNKTCLAYLREMTTKKMGAVYALYALDCDGIVMKNYEERLDIKGHNYKSILKYNGALPE